MIMATRSEQFRATQQKRRSKRAAKKAKEHDVKKARSKRSDHAHENVRAGKKATVALEPRSAKGKSSRKSSRGSANRSRADVNVSELRGERAQASPEGRYRTGK